MAVQQNIISNGRFTNYTNGIVRVTAIAENMTNHNMAIFSTILSVPDTGITLPLDTIMGRNREINDIFDTTGSYAGSTKGNEQLMDKTQSIQFADDYVYLAKKSADVATSKSAIYNMLAADIIINTDFSAVGTDGELSKSIWKIAGTNGNIKRGKTANSDLNHRYLLLQDGKLIVPQASTNDGSIYLQDNTRVAAYNTSTLCVMLEVMVEFSSTYKQGYRFAYCSPSNLTWNEGDDYNRISTDIQFLSDTRIIDNFFIDGQSSGEEKYCFTFETDLKGDFTKLFVDDGTQGTPTDRPKRIKTEEVTELKGLSHDYTNLPRIARLYYKDSVKGNGYVIIEQACSKEETSGDLYQKVTWFPKELAVDVNGEKNVLLKKDSSVQVTENRADAQLEYGLTFAAPIYNFDFEDAKFLPYGVPKSTIDKLDCTGAMAASYMSMLSAPKRK